MKKKQNQNVRLAFLFERYVLNKCTKDELNELLNELEKQKDANHLDIFTFPLWKAINQCEKADLTAPQIKTLKEEVKTTINKATESQPKRLVLHSNILRIAAAVLIFVASGIAISKYVINTKPGHGIFHMAYHYYSTDTTTRQITLEDGSVIDLNKNTSLHTSKRLFNKNKRKIWLDEGEAFFDVAKDPEKEFVVNSGDLQTIVHGTSFNIKAYEVIGLNVVSVREGTVEIKDKEQNFGLFTENMQLTYNLNNQTGEVSNIDWEDAAAWKNNRLIFTNANLEEIKLRLNQFYGVTLETEGNALQDILFNARFNTDASLNQVLERISLLYNIKYSKNTEGIVKIYK